MKNSNARKRSPKDQRYFYTREWQLKEREADEAIAQGDLIGPFDDATSAIRALRNSKVILRRAGTHYVLRTP